MSAFTETYPGYKGDAILGEWMMDIAKLFTQPDINPYAAQRQISDYLAGIWDFGHMAGVARQGGDNLITLLKDAENEK